MTRARWLLSAASLLVLWLLGALVFLPRMEKDLEAAAQAALSRQPSLAGRLDALHLEFDGQQARLTGSVRTPQDRTAIESALLHQVRVPSGLGRHLNPVGGVHSEIQVVPAPPGWLFLAAQGSHARLLGKAASNYEARDLARSVHESWNTQGGVTEGAPAIDPAHHDEAATVAATLRAVPPPQADAQAHLARIGQSWQELALNKTDAGLQAEARVLGVTDAEWQHTILPALQDLRAVHHRQQLAQMEKERLARLPPGHLFLAVRDDQIVLRGEVGSAAMKRAVLEEAIHAFSPRRLHDEIRVSPQRRPEDDFGPITTALLPEGSKAGGKSCFLGFSGGAWKPVDWQTAPGEQSWKQDLPSGIDVRLLLQDSVVLSGWLQGDGAYAPPSAQPAEPAFIALALFGTRAILSGQVAEESVRAQLIAAAHRAYSPQFLVISEFIHVRARCQPSTGILQTLQSLPAAPSPGGPAVFAIARPGGAWTLIPVTQPLVEAGGLSRSGLVPAGIPPSVVEDLASESVEQLRMHLAHPVSR